MISINDKNYISIYSIGYLGKDKIKSGPVMYQLYYKDKLILEKYILDDYQSQNLEIPFNKLLNTVSVSTHLDNYFDYTNNPYLKMKISFLNLFK